MKELYSALNRAQRKMTGAAKDAVNPFFKSHYADLPGVVAIFQEFFSPEGLSFAHVPVVVDGHQLLKCVLGHISGECVEGEYLISPVKADPQGVGSALTYARRYSLACLTGIVSGDMPDDDGEAAQGRAPAKPTNQPTKPDPVRLSISAFRSVLESPTDRWRLFISKFNGYTEKMYPNISEQQQQQVSKAISVLVVEIVAETMSSFKNSAELEAYWKAGSPDFCQYLTVDDRETLENTYQSLIDTLSPGINNDIQF